MDKRRMIWIYEVSMALLALLVLWLLTFPEELEWVAYVNRTVWAIFAGDYVARLLLARDRRQFLRSNLPDLIAVMPLDELRIVRMARLLRLVRLARAASVLWRVGRDVRAIVTQNSLGHVLLFTAGIVVLSSGLVWLLDDNIESLGDALWWGVATVTTVGYGDVAPTSAVGRLVAVVLMLVGIGTIGWVTGSIATYFISGAGNGKNPHVEYIRQQLARWDELEPEQRRLLAAMLVSLCETHGGGGGR